MSNLNDFKMKELKLITFQRERRDRIILPLFMRAVATIMIPIILLTMTPYPLMANASTSSASANSGALAPPKELLERVRADRAAQNSQSKAKINKSQPQASAPQPPKLLGENPTDQELFRFRVFAEALVPSEGTSDTTDNRQIAKLLNEFKSDPKLENIEVIEAFLVDQPESRWAVALHANLGYYYYRSGFFSRALVSWEKAWSLGKAQTGKIKALVDRSVSEWALMNGRIGRYDELDRIFAEVEGRDLRASETIMQKARDGRWSMEHKPEESFRCGPFGVWSVLNSLGFRELAENPLIDDLKSTREGTSLDQIHKLTKDLKTSFAPAMRQGASAFPVPSVVHWKVGHFGALIKEVNGRYQLKDPTFQDELWVTKEALEEEASGYFLIPLEIQDWSQPLPQGYEILNSQEAASVKGKGSVGDIDDDVEEPPCCPGDEDCEEGMPVYSISKFNANLQIYDIPLSHRPPKGPKVYFKLYYNHIENDQPANFDYSYVGPKWTHNWVSYIEDDPADVNTGTGTANIEIYNSFGGSYTLVYDPVYDHFSEPTRTRAVVKRTGTSPITYEMIYPDGAKRIYSNSDGTTSNDRRIFMSQKMDRNGNALSFNYDAVFTTRLAEVVDALGNSTTLKYEHPTDNYLITSITDPFDTSGPMSPPNNRKAHLDYDTSGRLNWITDAVGITSTFTYAAGDFIDSMTTPYGVTRFEKEELAADWRWTQATDPTGATERVEFRDDAPIPESLPAVPVGMKATTQFQENRNSFYWDKNAWAKAPGDYSQAVRYHWQKGPGNIAYPTLELLDKPLEAPIWYEYEGGSATGTGDSDQPIFVGRLLDDGTSQITAYEYNFRGKVTKMTGPYDPNDNATVRRSTTYVYDSSNGIDLKEVRQTSFTPGGSAIDELLMEYEYGDSANPRLATKVIDASGLETRYVYNANGQMTSMTNAKNEVTTYIYDGNGYLLEIDGPLTGNSDKISLTYDAIGRVETQTDSEGYVLTYFYDQLNRITSIQYPDASTVELIYTKDDGTHRLDPVWSKDRKNRWTKITYDGNRRPIAKLDPAFRLNQYVWCDCGSLSQLIDANGNITEWVRDIQGREIEKVYPDLTSIKYEYDELGRLKDLTDAEEQTRTYDYFIDNRVQSLTYTNSNITTPDVSYTYDAHYGRLETMTDGIGITSYAYYPFALDPTDPNSSKAGRLHTVNGPFTNDTVTYEYDELGRMAKRQINGAANEVENSYDLLGRIDQQTNPLGVFDYDYVGATPRLQQIDLPNGLQTTFDYHDNLDDQRLEEIHHTTSGGGTISQFNYDYDVVGNITSWTQNHSGLTNPINYQFEYDPVDQLLAATKIELPMNVLSQYVYQYDKAGNRISEQIDSKINQCKRQWKRHRKKLVKS